MVMEIMGHQRQSQHTQNNGKRYNTVYYQIMFLEKNQCGFISTGFKLQIC